MDSKEWKELREKIKHQSADERIETIIKHSSDRYEATVKATEKRIEEARKRKGGIG